MLDILDVYLRDAVTPQLYDVIDAAHKAFDRVGEDDYEPGFEQILMTDGDVNRGETAVAITDLTVELQEKVLRESGIVMQPEATIGIRTLAINALLDLQGVENPEAMIAVLRIDGPPAEQLAELLTLVTPLSVEEWLLDIETVDPALIIHLTDQFNEQEAAAFDPDSVAFKHEHVRRIKQFMEYAKSPDLIMLKQFASGLDVGFPFAVYIETLGTGLETLPPFTAAQELVVMALASSDGMDNPRHVIATHLEHYVADLATVTRITVAVSDLLLGLNQHG